MGKQRLVLGIGAACALGCALASLAPLMLSLAFAGLKLGLFAMAVLVLGVIAGLALRHKLRQGATCRIDRGCSCPPAQAGIPANKG